MVSDTSSRRITWRKALHIAWYVNSQVSSCGYTGTSENEKVKFVSSVVDEFSKSLCQSALQVAARYGAGNVVQALLSRRAEVDSSDNWGKTPLHEAAWYGQDDVVKILLQNNASFALHDKSGKVPLHEAVWFGRTAVVQALLEHGADVNAVDDNGLTPLHYASELESARILETLLDGGGEPNARDKEGMTPLHYAAWFGHEEVLTVLLNHEADMTVQDLQGHTALHYAVEHGELGAVKVLLEAGADIDAQDNNGNTVVHLACRSPEPLLMVPLLLLRCPRLTARNVIYKTAADVALDDGLSHLATLIDAQSRTPCGVEGASCEREGALAVTPLQPLTCNSSWALATRSLAHEDCWHRGQLYRHWASWYDGCRESKCVHGHLLQEPYTGTSCCQVGEDVYPENATWSQGCHHYRCTSGGRYFLLLVNSLNPVLSLLKSQVGCSRGKNVYADGETWPEGCYRLLCKSGDVLTAGRLTSCCRVAGELHGQGSRWTNGCLLLRCQDGRVLHDAMTDACKLLMVMVAVAVAGVVGTLVLGVLVLRLKRGRSLIQT
ncbi:ankyrin-1 [Penaeus vannamei]|uniref:ankyrin-1 n=1 Tax=Penaeus vannamei TaxID=6689 RepID=UPI00387F46EF